MATDMARRRFIAAFGAAAATGRSLRARRQPAAVATSGNESDKIAPLDVLDITVFKVPDLVRPCRSKQMALSPIRYSAKFQPPKKQPTNSRAIWHSGLAPCTSVRLKSVSS